MKTVQGDIFKLMQPGDAMMHGCNAQGVMGSGIALTVRNLYPGAFRTYEARHYAHPLQLGEVIPYFAGDGKTILNCITQEFFGRDGKRYVSYDAISECCRQIRAGFDILLEPPKTLYTPLIGAVQAGGCWAVIREILRDDLANKLSKTELVVVEYQP